MTGLDLTRLAPSDATVAVRSLPRRFGAVLRPPLAEDRPAGHDDLVQRIGPDGHSAVDHAMHVVRSLTLLDRAIEQVLISADPVLHPAVVDDHARWVEDHGHPPEPDDVLVDLAAAAERFAARVQRVPAADWSRTARVARDRGTVSAHDLLREAVGQAIEHLHAAERTIAALRGRGG
jgi:hypothetical protein